MGSYIGTPGFGLIHPNTISAAVMHTPNFDAVMGSGEPMQTLTLSPIGHWRSPRMRSGLHITKKIILGPDSLTTSRISQLMHDHRKARRFMTLLSRLSQHTQKMNFLPSISMSPLLEFCGANLRAHLYQQALSRAGLDKTPMRDTLKVLNTLVLDIIVHDWLRPRDWELIKKYLGNHPKIAEDFQGSQFRHLLWAVVVDKSVSGGLICW